MVITLGRKDQDTGIRPMRPSTDLGGVADLIEEAFAHELDGAGYAAIREMRNMGRMGFMLLWLDYLSPDVSTNLSGFVWVDQGRIVGNVTVSRRAPMSRHWFISNVAVSRSHRGRGIARELMDTAVSFVQEMSGLSVSLQVRQGNKAAEHIYQSMGFKYISASTFVRLSRIESVKQYPLPSGLRLRAHRLDLADTQAIYALARAFVPMEVQLERPLRQSQFRLGSDVKYDNFWRRLLGQGQVKHWVVELTSGKLVASLSVEPGKWRQDHKFSFQVHPEWWGRLEPVLVSQAVSYLRTCPPRPIAFQHPTEHPSGLEALAAAGFTLEKTHMWLKLSL